MSVEDAGRGFYFFFVYCEQVETVYAVSEHEIGNCHDAYHGNRRSEAEDYGENNKHCC